MSGFSGLKRDYTKRSKRMRKTVEVDFAFDDSFARI